MNNENKYDFQEIDNEIRDSYLRTSQVFDERNKLRDNWNSLREFVIELQKLKGINQQGFSWGVAQEVLDKMNELEGKSNDN